MKTKIETYTQLDNKFFIAWEKLWKKSVNGHIFNSPYWYKACIESNKYHELLILVYKSKKIDGILPLVKSKKFGFNVYSSPGEKYLDKSTFLNVNSSGKVFNALIKHLQTLGDYYLTEVSEGELLQVKNREIRRYQCSTSRSLNFENNPFRHMNSENVRKINKRILKYQLSLKIEKSLTPKVIKTIQKIEDNSYKSLDGKTTFSDNNLIAIIKNISTQNKTLLNFSLLNYKNKNIGYIYGYTTSNSYHFSNTAYNLNYAHLSPGKILMFLTISDLKNKGFSAIDFSRGDTQFKQEFTPTTYNQYSIYYFKNPLTMFIWNLAYSLKPLIEKNKWVMSKLIK